MPPRAVIFDFDGTLADSYAAITASVNHVRTAYNLPPLTAEDIRPNVGRGLPHLVRTCIPGADLDVAARLYREHHPSVLLSGTHLFPGIADMLQVLHERGLKLAVCSNKPRPFTQTLVRGLGIGDYLDAVIGPEDAPRPKPAPDMLLEALRRLGVSAADALYVGDMTVDIDTARAAGVAVWVVPTGSDTRATLEAAKPDRLLDRLTELPLLV